MVSPGNSSPKPPTFLSLPHLGLVRFGLWEHTQQCSGFTCGSLLRNHSWSCLGVRGPYGVKGIKPRSATCHVSVFLPHFSALFGFFFWGGGRHVIRGSAGNQTLIIHMQGMNSATESHPQASGHLWSSGVSLVESSI